MATGYGVQTSGGGYVSSGGGGGGGGPDAAFTSNLSSGGPPKGSAPNPYANVGKFNVSVVSPQGLSDSLQHDSENMSLIHGMSQAMFGENNESAFGGIPGVGLVGRVAANVTDFGASVGGNLLGAVGKVPNPFAAGYAHFQFMQSADTPEKRAAISKMDWNPFSILQAEADYLAQLRKDNPIPSSSETGLSALNPEAGVSKDPTAGGFVASVFDVINLTQLASQRTAAGFKGTEGNQLDMLLRKDPATLGATQQEAVSKFKSGEWSEDRALDHLVANNAGLSDDPRINIVFSALIDPLTWGTLGSALFARGGKVLFEVQRAGEAADRVLLAARTAKKAVVAEADEAINVASRAKQAGTAGAAEDLVAATAAKKEAVAAADEAIASAEQGIKNAAELPQTLEGYGRFSKLMARTIGGPAFKVMSSDTLGPIARVAHSVIDPTRLLFPERDPASRILKARLSLDNTMAVTHAFGEGDVYRTYERLDTFGGDLSDRVKQAIGEYTGGITRAWIARELGRDMLSRLPGEALGDVVQRMEARLAAMPHDVSVHIEQFTREVTPMSVTEAQVTTRMAAAFGGKAEEYAALVKGMNNNQLAYLHAATTAAARSDLLYAIGTQAANGTWKLKQSIEHLILIGPGELTETRAKALLAQLRKLKGPERVKAARDAVEQYDILRYSQHVTGEDSVAAIIDYVDALRSNGVLASELGGKSLTALTGEVGDWLAKYGQTVDGEPLYGLGFRPKDENLWRLVRDPKSQKIVSLSPWVDYVMERAPGYRPGLTRKLPYAPGVVQKTADWLAIGKQNLFHDVSTARVALEAKRRFIQSGMKMGLTESETRAIHGALEEGAVAHGAPMRGVSATDMWESTKDLIPYRLRTGPNAITKRQLIDSVLRAYTNELHVVGATQVFTGKLKEYLDRIPGAGSLAGGNIAGQVAEKVWPDFKFKYNPLFIVQEWAGENQYFSALKGVPVYFRGAVTESDELAYKVWGSFDQNLEGVGDQIENSTTVLLGHIEGTLESATGMKRTKYVNAARQFRNTLGEIGRKNFSPEFMSELKAHYNNLNDGEVMLRWIDEQMQAGRDVTNILGMGGRNAYEDIIKAADWTKPVEQGAIAPLHLDTLARRMGFTDEITLVRALRSKTNALTKSDIHTRLQELNATEGYIDRVMNALDWRGVDSWYKAAQKQYKLSDSYVAAHKAMMNASARLRGMSTSEYMSQIVTNKIGVFRDPKNLPVTDRTFMRAVKADLRKQGKVLYDTDSPEVAAVLTRAKEMRGLSALNPKRAATLQRAHDRVNADPKAYQPGGRRGRVKVHETKDGRRTYTGNVGWKETKDNLERHVGLRDDATGEIPGMDGILDSANWYNELPGFVLSMTAGDTELAAKVLLGFLYTQKATSPVQGMRLILKAADRYNFTSETGLERFFTEDLQLSKAVTRKVFLGEPITEGLGAKLFDFTDAGLRVPTRFMGLHAPTPSDRWMIRARGYMDESGLDEFLKAYGYKNARAAGYLDPELFRVTTVDPVTGKISRRMDSKAYDAALQRTKLQRVYTGVSDSMYEETTRWTNDMARQANLENGGKGWLGKNNWTGSEMQAVIWVGAQKAVDAYPEAGADMFFHNATQMALEVRPSERGPFHILSKDWDQLDDVGKTALTDEMASHVAAVFSQRLKIPVMAYHTGVVGAWEGVIAPNFTLQIAGTGETVDRAVLSGLAANGQDAGIAVREMPTVFSRSAHNKNLYHAIDFILPTGMRDSNETAQLIARLPSMVTTGFMPFERDGVVRLRSLAMTDKNTSVKGMTKQMETLRAELDAANLSGVQVELKGTHVIQHEQDWVGDPQGLDLQRRLDALGEGGQYARRQLFGDVDEAGTRIQPILGEFRTLADQFINDTLEGAAYRGRSPVGDLAGVSLEEGSARIQEALTRSRRVLPPEPGTAPLQPGYVRAYHYTSSDPATLASIREKGLLRSEAKGETYGEPNQIWFSTTKPDDDRYFVEVHLRPDQITGSGSPGRHLFLDQKLMDEWIDWKHKTGANFASFMDEIHPSQIASYNEPWMHTYRYLVEDVTTRDELMERSGAWLSPERINTPVGQAVSKRLDDLEAAEEAAGLQRMFRGEQPGVTGIPADGFTDGTEALKYANEYVTRGAMTLNKDGRSMLWASQDAADPLTFMHEVAHAAHTHMDPSMSDRLMVQFRKETGSRARKWNRHASEWFADSYIRTIREGIQVADPELQRAYNYFAKWSDRAINRGLLKGETKGFEARGALTKEEHTALTTPMRPETKSLFSEMLSGPKGDAHPFNHNEEMVWNAMTDAVKEAGYDAFRVNFFKRNRTLLERSVNHPVFGLYPASYMWGKVLPELVRFLVKDPFGIPGGHIAYAANDVQRSIAHQSLIDPEFAKAVDAIGKNALVRILGLLLPATPWEIPVNAPAWARRVAQAGLENEAAAKAGRAPTPLNPAKIWADTMSYQFGAIPQAFKTFTQPLTGAEDIYSMLTGEPTTGKNAPSLGKGLSTVTKAINKFGEPLGDSLPSINDVFSQDDTQLTDILDQNDALQQDLTDAQTQLESIFTQYPFTQQ